jgi:hypothetical protein
MAAKSDLRERRTSGFRVQMRLMETGIDRNHEKEFRRKQTRYEEIKGGSE